MNSVRRQQDIKYEKEPELKNTVTEMKSTLEGINRLEDTEDWINDLDVKVNGRKKKKWSNTFSQC